jgi:hypothetical protein
LASQEAKAIKELAASEMNTIKTKLDFVVEGQAETKVALKDLLSNQIEIMIRGGILPERRKEPR